MRFGSLFSGIGGFDLGLERAGMEVAWQVELDPFCCKVLEKHWPGVKRYGDIRTVGSGELEAVDLICGGPPCQPASCAGKRRGAEDNRWLWPETLRLVAALKPRWCLFENPTGILSLQGGLPFESVLSELEGQGYEVQAYIIPACAVDAPHRRNRVWIVAHAARIGRGTWRPEPAGQQGETGITGGGRDVADAQSQQAGGIQFKQFSPDTGAESHGRGQAETRPVEPGLGRNFARLPRGMDGYLWPAPFGCEQYEHEPPRIDKRKRVKGRTARIKGLGNSVVPELPEIIGRAILAAEGVK